jgi:hypothetical protein
MRRFRQLSQPSRQERSPGQFAAALALALLILAGGVAVTVWNAQDLIAELFQEEDIDWIIVDQD